MSEHDELADKLEAEANYLEAESDHNVDKAVEARDAMQQAQRDELVPAPMGEEDPAHRETPEGEGVEGVAAGDPADETPPAEEGDDPAKANA